VSEAPAEAQVVQIVAGLLHTVALLSVDCRVADRQNGV